MVGRLKDGEVRMNSIHDPNGEIGIGRIGQSQKGEGGVKRMRGLAWYSERRSWEVEQAQDARGRTEGIHESMNSCVSRIHECEGAVVEVGGGVVSPMG